MVPATRSSATENLRRLVQELVKFFLELGHCPIHGLFGETPAIGRLETSSSRPRFRSEEYDFRRALAPGQVRLAQ
jgi:hypothetical protein